MSQQVNQPDTNILSFDHKRDETYIVAQNSKDSEAIYLNPGMDFENKWAPSLSGQKVMNENDSNIDSKVIETPIKEINQPETPIKTQENAQKNKNQGFLNFLQIKPKVESKPEVPVRPHKTIDLTKIEISNDKVIVSPKQAQSQTNIDSKKTIPKKSEDTQDAKQPPVPINSIKSKLQFLVTGKKSETEKNPPLSPPSQNSAPPQQSFLKQTGSKLLGLFTGKSQPTQAEASNEQPKPRPMAFLVEKISKPLHNTLLKKQRDEEIEKENQIQAIESMENLDAHKKSVHSSDESELSETEAQALKNLSKIKTRYGEIETDNEVEHNVPSALVSYVNDKVTGRGLLPTNKAIQKDPRLRILLEKHAIKKKNNKDFKKIVKDAKKNETNFSRILVKLRNKCGSVFDLILLIYYKLKKPFDPKNPIKMTWDVFIGLLIFWTICYIPFDIAFGTGHNKGIRRLEIFLTIMFFIDILLNFHTGYYKDVHLIRTHRKIFKNYFFGWFWVDFISSLPIGTLFLEEDEYQGTPLIRLWSILKVARVFKLARIVKIKKTLNEFRESFQFSQLAAGFINFFRLFCIVLGIAHFVACFWFYVSKMAVLGGRQGWISSKIDPEDDISTQYLTSLYWTITTMMTVGYGDITPVSQSEKVVAMFVMLFGCGVYGYCINKTAEILTEINREYSYQT